MISMTVHEKLTLSKITGQTRLTRTNELDLKWEGRVFPITNPDDLQTTWRDWAVQETVKRYLLVF